MALALLILVAAALATGLAGLSVALGAFLAGMLLSDSEARHHIEVDLDPFKGLLLGIFFITVGTRLDPVAIAGDAGWIVLGTLVLLAVKAAILFAVARGFGLASGTAAELALLLAQAGEFAFVVIGVAHRDALVSDRMSNGAVAVVGLSMMATPLLAFAGRKLATRLSLNAAGDHGPTADAAELENHVVIGGCGRVAQMVMQALETENVPYVCLDTNHEAVAAMRRQGRQAYFGDATRAELLEKIGGAQARAFVVTLNRAAGAERMVTAARKVNRSAFIFARAADATHAARLVKRGAFGVIPETVEASIQLTGRLLETLDVPEDTVARRMSEMRDAEIEKLDRAEAGEAV
jgi:CPA2 family monovalent cation:H+ antiporter-2